MQPSALSKELGESLLDAALKGNAELVRTLIESRANVNFINRFGDSALILAAENGHAEVVGLLIKAEANVNLINQNDESALILAAFKGHDKVVNSLLNAGADFDLTTSSGLSALMLATDNGHDKVVDSLINAGVDVNYTNPWGGNALILAARNGHAEVVDSLINAGAGINLTTSSYLSALMLAIENGHDKVVDSLINAGVDVNYTNPWGGNALILAAEKGPDKVFNSLIVAGADVNLEIKEGFYAGKTPIELVAINPTINEKEKQEIFSKLYDIGANIRPEFFNNDAISDNMKDFAREHNTPENALKREENLLKNTNLQDAFKESILAGKPITFRDNVVDKVLLKALKSITADDLGNASKENVIKLRRSGVYSLLKIEEHLNDKEFSLSAKNLKDFKAISDKAPFVRSSNKLDEDMMSKILMHSLMPNSLGKDLTLKIINQIKILTAPANRSNPPLVPPNNSDGTSARLLDPHQHSAQAPNTPTSTPNFQSSITNPVVTEQLVFTPATDVNTRPPTPSVLHENPSSIPAGRSGVNAAEAVAKTAGLNDSR